MTLSSRCSAPIDLESRDGRRRSFSRIGPARLARAREAAAHGSLPRFRFERTFRFFGAIDLANAYRRAMIRSAHREPVRGMIRRVRKGATAGLPIARICSPAGRGPATFCREIALFSTARDARHGSSTIDRVLEFRYLPSVLLPVSSRDEDPPGCRSSALTVGTRRAQPVATSPSPQPLRTPNRTAARARNRTTRAFPRAYHTISVQLTAEEHELLMRARSRREHTWAVASRRLFLVFRRGEYIQGRWAYMAAVHVSGDLASIFHRYGANAHVLLLRRVRTSGTAVRSAAGHRLR